MAWKVESAQIITSLALWEEARKEIDKAEYIAVDTETTGLERFAQAVGIGIAVSPHKAYYIPVSVYTPNSGLKSPWQASAWNTLSKELIEAFTKSKRIITHNGVFDAKILHNLLGTNIVPYVHADTQLLHHTCISEEPPHGLKPLATKYLDPEASSSQDDLKASVLSNGGQWLVSNKEMYKGDYTLVGRYCMHDCMYTFGLYELFYPEIAKQGLVELWDKEVLPLMQVTFELNTTGIRVDVEYFKKLKVQMEERIQALEDDICASMETELEEYSYKKILENTVVTKRSELGKYLLSKGVDIDNLDKPLDKLTIALHALDDSNPGLTKSAVRRLVLDWYNKKNGVKRAINLDSGEDKAFILYDVLGYECKTLTKTGKRQVTASTLEELDLIKKNPILDLMLDRSAETKLLSTYVIPILENNIEGRLYPSFNQTGTITGRYSCAEPMNFQTLPRGDLRIKQGFIPDEGRVFVNADFASLEPKVFGEVSNEAAIKAVYLDNLDLYSQIAIQVLGLKGVSARESDPNFLKKIDPEARQLAKVIALAFAYGMTEYKAAKQLKIEVIDALRIKNKYFAAFPNLLKYQQRQQFLLKKYGFVTNLVGRKRRGRLVPAIIKAGYSTDHNMLFRQWSKIAPVVQSFGYTEAKKVATSVNNEFNNSYNFPIQSLAASICNTAMIELKAKIDAEKLDAKLILNVHDEITLTASKKDAARAAELLQESMENNRVTKLISIPMKAEPIITDKSLAEAK